MAKEKKNGGKPEEEVDKTDTEEETTDDESAEDAEDEEESEDEEAEDESDEESEDEDKSDGSKKTENELDLDAELEKERKAGSPDPVIAKEQFKERDKKRDGKKGDEDKPLTQKDVDAIEARIRKEQQQERALEIAKELAGSDKEAELIVAKWANRTFPKTLTLREQMQEAYVITHSKKLIGERNEAMRALKGKKGVKTDSASAHQDAPKGNEPKLSPADAASLKASGFSWNTNTRQYEKKLPNGRLLIRDNKTKQVRLVGKR